MAKDSPTSTLRLPPKNNSVSYQNLRLHSDATKAQDTTQSSTPQYFSPYKPSPYLQSNAPPKPSSPSSQPTSTIFNPIIYSPLPQPPSNAQPKPSSPPSQPTSNITQPTGNIVNPTIVKMVSEVIARATANAVNIVSSSNKTKPSSEWETAMKAAEEESQSPSTSESSGISTFPTAETPNQARTGGRRGRGPRRRGGPRKVLTEPEIIEVDVETNGDIETPSRGRPIGRPRGSGNRGGRPRGSRARGGGRGGRPRGSRGVRGSLGSLRGGKRKRNEDDDGNDTDDTDSSENITPLPTQSRSGRKIFQAQQTTPIIKISDAEVTFLESSPATKLVPDKLTPNQNTPDKRPKKKIKTTGGGAVCKNCSRSHSPLINLMVFCDECNNPWHQYCHNPPITAEDIQIEDTEWFCTDCTILREETERLTGRVAGENMSLAEKRQYFQSLPQTDLVSLLLHACALYPTLPIFEPKANSGAEEQYYEDEDVLPYPKAGYGILLPPESEDMAYLLDEDVEVFSHSWIGKPGLPQGDERFLAEFPVVPVVNVVAVAA